MSDYDERDDMDEDEYDDDDDDDEEDEVDGNTVTAANARTVLEYLVRQVVDDPDAVEVRVDDSHRQNVALDVTVGDGDMGRVIGRKGRVANAIRTVTRAAASKDGIRAEIEFLD